MSYTIYRTINGEKRYLLSFCTIEKMKFDSKERAQQYADFKNKIGHLGHYEVEECDE